MLLVPQHTAARATCRKNCAQQPCLQSLEALSLELRDANGKPVQRMHPCDGAVLQVRT